MTTDLVIVGCGGFGREVVGIVDAINASGSEPAWNLLGFVDDDPSPDNLSRVARLGLPLIGDMEALKGRLAADSSLRFVLAVADPSVRRRLAERLDSDVQAATLIDPDARIGRDVRVGPGVIIAAHAHVTTNVDLGAHVHLDRAVQVGHDSRLDEFATVHPASVLSGGVQLHEATRIGTGATVLPQLALGPGATVGAGACVVRHVAHRQTVKGIPAR